MIKELYFERRRNLLGAKLETRQWRTNTLDGKFTTSDKKGPEDPFLFGGRGKETTTNDVGQKFLTNPATGTQLAYLVLLGVLAFCLLSGNQR